MSLADANEGDTSSLPWSLLRAETNLSAVATDPRAQRKLHDRPLTKVVADKGYHSNEDLVDLTGSDIRRHVSEPDRGRRNWKDKEEAQAAVYANRRRLRSSRGQRLQNRRAEFVERSFAALVRTLESIVAPSRPVYVPSSPYGVPRTHCRRRTRPSSRSAE